MPLSPDKTELESIFKSINQPIWIVTSAANGKRSGLTATWVHQASIDAENPTVLIGLAPNHFTCETLSRSRACVIHLMCNDQAEIVYRFAQPSSRGNDKFLSLAVNEFNLNSSHDSTRIPWLTESHTAIGCTAIHEFDAGDRIYFLCRVARLLKKSDGPFMRETDFFSHCTPEQIEALRSDLQTDVRLQRPLLAAWAKNLQKE